MLTRNGDKTNELQQLLNSNAFTAASAMALLAAGADPDAVGANGDALLHKLVEDKANDADVSKVAEYKADFNIKDRAGLTPLQRLMKKRAFQIAPAMKLIELGANPNVPDQYGKSILHAAAFINTKGNQSKNIETLITKIDINILNDNGLSPLLYLLSNFSRDPADTIATAEWLISKGADLKAVDKQNRTALHLAASVKGASVNGASPVTSPAIVEWLVNTKKLPVDTTNNAKQTPLFIACVNGNMAIAKSLKTAGAKLADVSQDGKTMLHAAVMSNDLSTVQWVVESKEVDLTTVDNLKNTILTVNKTLDGNIKSYLEPLLKEAQEAQTKQAADAAAAAAAAKNPAGDPAPQPNPANTGAPLPQPNLPNAGDPLPQPNLPNAGDPLPQPNYASTGNPLPKPEPEKADKEPLPKPEPEKAKDPSPKLESDPSSIAMMPLKKAPPAPTAKELAFNLFKKNHETSLDNALFSFIKKIFSKMRNFLFNDPTQPIKTIDDVGLYAKNNPGTRSAAIYAAMNCTMTLAQFKVDYEDARSKKIFNNPLKNTISDALKKIGTAEEDASFTMDTVREHAMNDPDSLTAQVIKSSMSPKP